MAEFDDREMEKLAQGQILREASMQLLPLLSTMRESIVGRIIAAHREGKPDGLSSLAAELTVVSDLAGRITRSNKETEIREGRLFGAEPKAE